MEKAMGNANRYSAKLLFQFMFDSHTSNSIAIVEERILLIYSKNAGSAYVQANNRGKKSEHSFLNNEKVKVKFKFVGILELIHLGVEVDEDEVWYSIRKMKSPLHRKNKIIRPKEMLSAFINEQKLVGKLTSPR